MNNILQTEKLLSNLVQFIINNRKGRAFENYTEDELYITFRDALTYNTILFASDNETGEIYGVAHGHFNPITRVFHVSNILATRPGVMAVFMFAFDKMYPCFQLKATRRGKQKTYNLAQFRRKLQYLLD